MLIIGVDTGGTFTDFIWHDGGQWHEHKRLSTPDNPAAAVLAGLREITGMRPFAVCHGSTVATNAILEHRGARTALVTNRGFTDVIEIGRQQRPELYHLACRRTPPLVPETLRFGVAGRIGPDGDELVPLAENELPALATAIREARVESVAVCGLFSFANPAHERRLRDALTPLGIPVSLSAEVLPEFREYERTSTTVVNAYVAPVMDRYLAHLTDRLGDRRPLRIMQSNGGSITAATARRESVRTILSGPAGGAVGAAAIGRTAGHEKLITFDMGGTSTDVALIDGRLPLTMEGGIAGLPVRVPMIDIHTVGAGGGSIAHLDAGGALNVGPRSAGADPGPVCYGRGTDITVTDANLYLGRLLSDRFLGGSMTLDRTRLKEPFAALAEKLRITPTELAEGILTIANTTMERAIRVISVERGHDPRDFALFSFGGAGGLHACFLAAQLGIPTVLVPCNPGLLSALGMLLADIVKDFSRTVMLDGVAATPKRLRAELAPLEEQGRRELAAEGVTAAGISTEPLLDMRYRGQSHELMVPFTTAFRQAFDELHARIYGHADDTRPVEVVNVRLRARGTPKKPPLERLPPGGPVPSAAAFVDERAVIFAGRPHTTRIIDRARLLAGNIVDGPAIVTEYSSTIVVPPFAALAVDAFGNLIITIGNTAVTAGENR
ncbi:MAG: hydantoinase/oxoprolinase family protein [Deltaproteobacteria bacterium]|nr:hydantoinase/oxoprolinase family protein [Candidatus Anaeroferrophillacea bacterium]